MKPPLTRPMARWWHEQKILLRQEQRGVVFWFIFWLIVAGIQGVLVELFWPF